MLRGEFVRGPAAGIEVPRLLIQVWGETLRNESLAALLRTGYDTVRAAWVKVVEAYQAAGLMRDDIPAERVARTMLSMGAQKPG